jgi:hypothetical protein
VGIEEVEDLLADLQSTLDATRDRALQELLPV